MKTFRKVIKSFGVVALAGLFAMTNVLPVMAANDEIPDTALQLSPAKIDIGDLKPGEVTSGVLKVSNAGQTAYDFQMGVEPFTVKNGSYEQTYEANEKYNDIVDWVTFSPKGGHLDPGDQVEIKYTITVPKDVPAGGQYGILMAQTVPENKDNSSDVQIVHRVGTLLYSNVAGNTRKTGAVLENKVPGFRFNPPITATSLVENTGNTHATATYVLQVFPLFGDEEVYTNEEDPVTLTILPETRRLNTVSWPSSPQLGIFRVKQTVTIFNERSVTEKVVFLCPIWLLIIVLAAIFCAVFWIVTRIRARKQERA